MVPRTTALVADERTSVPHRGRTTLLALVLPLAIAAGGAWLALSWRPELPDPVATHWGADGVNGVGSLTGQVLVLTLLGVGCAVAGWALAYFVGRASAVRRMGVATSLGMTTFLSGLLLATLRPQRGLTDAYQAPDAMGAALLTVAVAAVVVACLGALAVRRDAPLPTTRPVLPPDGAQLPPDARVAWVQHVRSVAPSWLGAGVGVLLVALGMLTGTAVFLVPLGVLLAAVLATFASFTVTVDERGLRARGAFGWPRLAVPLSEVERSTVTEVRALHDFGGWGYRVGRHGRVGIVARSGEGIEVGRTGGRVVVVTVDDAATGARLLQALAARASARPVTGE